MTNHIKNQNLPVPEVVLVAAVLVLIAGCAGAKSANSSTTGAQDSTGKDSPASQTQHSTGDPDSLDRCALIKDSEVENAIGPHHAGSSDLGNEWGLQSCKWTATKDQKVKGFPDGWFEVIDVGVFDQDPSWARQQAKGEPVKGFVEGALYDASYGELWFPCSRGRFCVVKARTASDKNREQIARQLAELVNNRLR